MDKGSHPMAGAIPGWVPDAVAAYLAHVQSGRSIRDVARACGCQPSTISRRVRRIENRRDDLLFDAALTRLGLGGDEVPPRAEDAAVGHTRRSDIPSEVQIEREAGRALRRLAEPGACLALAPAMEQAVIVREAGEGMQPVRTAVVDRTVAEAMALKDWIATSGGARIMRYRITATGRAALKEIVAGEENRRAAGIEEDEDETPEAQRSLRARQGLAETPLAMLARRREKDGEPFLTAELVAAGERLREDFELAQVGPQVTQNWEGFLTGRTPGNGSSLGGSGSEAARHRVALALRALGPGLGDVALRCCCYLEGLETTEKRMGWSARSGKVVLRIALQRLRLHYSENPDHWSPLIG